MTCSPPFDHRLGYVQNLHIFSFTYKTIPFSQLLITAPRDEAVGAFVHKLLHRGKANAAIATSNECNFPSSLFMYSSPRIKACQIVRTTLPKGRPSTR